MVRQWHVKCHVNGSTDSKVVSQRNDSNIEKIESYIKEKFDEVTINHLKQKMDLKDQYPPPAAHPP